MALSTQTYTYIILLAITSVINLITFSVAAGGYGFMFYSLVFIISLPFVLLAIYNINCLTTGECNTFAWILVILSSVYMIITTIMMVFMASSVSDMTSSA